MEDCVQLGWRGRDHPFDEAGKRRQVRHQGKQSQGDGARGVICKTITSLGLGASGICANNGRYGLNSGRQGRSELRARWHLEHRGLIDRTFESPGRLRLRSEFGNGDSLYAKAGEVIALPEQRTTGRTLTTCGGTLRRCSRNPNAPIVAVMRAAADSSHALSESG